ncbi:MAG: hypothetical protein U9R08_03230 [Nanoarchaeota archaeon]|nr:hypothetical protein [Nanoarchaeota archaeon]
MIEFSNKKDTFIDKVVRSELESEHLVQRVIREVENGRYHNVCSKNLTYGNALMDYERRGLVDKTTVDAALLKGKLRRVPLVLGAVAKGRGYRWSGFQRTFGQEMNELVDEGYIDELDADVAVIGEILEGKIMIGGLFDSNIDLPKLKDPETTTLYVSLS